jgi:putative ABC transport system permease protein
MQPRHPRASRFRAVFSILRALVTRRRFEEAMTEELASHVEHRADDLVRAGMPRDEALRRARREFGSVANVKVDCREAGGLRWIDDAIQDLRYTARGVTRNPGLHLVIVATLALAIGANQMIFRAVETIFVRPLPYREAERLAVVFKAASATSQARQLVRLPEFDEWRRSNQTFEALAFFTPPGGAFMSVAGEGPAPAEEIRLSWVSANFMSVLGADPMLGAGFTSEQAGVILAHDFWQRRFAGASNALGAIVTIAQTEFRVVGIMPRTMTFPAPDVDVWAVPEWLPQWRDIRAGRGPAYALILGRLAAPTTGGDALSRAQDDVRRIGSRVTQPDDGAGALFAIGLRRYVFGDSIRSTALMLWAAVMAVVLVGSLNVAGLLLARDATRTHEMTTRRALGAGTGRLLRQLMAESLMLAVAASVLSLPLSIWGVRLLASLLTGLSDDGQIAPSLANIAFSCVLVLATGLALGLVPAFQLLRRRPSALNLRAITSPVRGSFVQSALMVGQLAITVAFLVATGVLVRSYVAADHVDLGFDRQRVLTLFAGSGDLGLDFYPRAIDRLRRLPGVEHVGASNTLMFLPAGANTTLKQVDGKPPEPPEDWRPLWSLRVGGEYFQALGITVLEGRVFDQRDGPGVPPVAVVNETLARRFWPGESPVGKRFRDVTPQGAGDPWITVVGLVRDTRSFGLEQAPVAQWFQPQPQSGRATTVMFIRTGVPPESLVPAVRAALHELDKGVRISRVGTLEGQVSQQTRPRRLQSAVMLAFSGFVLLLAALGVHALMQCAISRRTREIGIRVAIGATRAEIVRVIMGQTLRLSTLGLALGGLVAVAAVRLMSSLLFGVATLDPLTLVLAPMTLLTCAVLASVLPLRRATTIDPVRALRGD